MMDTKKAEEVYGETKRMPPIMMISLFLKS